MSSPSKEQVLDRLRTVKDPELHRDLVSLDMIKDIAICDGIVKVHIELTTPACPLKDQIDKDVRAALGGLDGVKDLSIEWSAQVRGNNQGRPQLPGVKNIIAVGAGKGGVGKSTAAVLVAIGLQRAGAKVGLMDADVYGPSIPTMLGLTDVKPSVSGDKILPVEAFGLHVMSIGFMVERDKPLIWRGPMVHGVVKQFLEQVAWGELDYLVVDLPPGTGDVPLTLAQSIPMTGAVVICTPQEVALADARRAVKMYEQLNVPSLGIIENMSYYLCPHCNGRDDIFGHGGAAAAALELNVPFLGELPLNSLIRHFGDQGTPTQLFSDENAGIRDAVDVVVRNLAGQITVRNMQQTAAPTLSVE